jgi:tetratricopeptide (TPR) repeat protein
VKPIETNKMKRSLGLIVFTVITQLIIGQSKYVDFDQGYQFYLEGSYPQALTAFDKSISTYPEHSDSHYFKALIQARMGDYNNALIGFNKAIELSPKDGAYYGDRGVLYAMQSKMDLAIEDFKYAAKYDSLNPARHFNLAIYYFENNDCEEAILHFNNCLLVDSNHLKARFQKAICNIRLQNFEGAIEDLSYLINNFEDQSTVLNPFDYNNLLSVAYSFRGGIYGEQKEYEKSVSDYKHALKYDKNNSEIYNNLGYYILFTDEKSKSIEYLDKSIELDKNIKNLNSRSFAYYKLGNYEKAEIDAKSAIAIDDKYYESFYNLALIYNALKEIKKACDMKNKAIEFGFDNNDKLDKITCD